MAQLAKVPSSGPEDETPMRQVLAESAPLARQWAAESCWLNPETGKSCAWYHGAWQTWRLLGIVTTLTQQAPLYIDALRPLIASGDSKRVFISGSADYGLLSVVLDAFSQEGALPKITVADRCATPLRLCRWYAERFGYSITTAQSHIAEFRSETPFDLICAHSLLLCIPHSEHAKVVASWQRLLRPGGLLLMANNIYPEVRSKFTRFTPDQVTAYRERIATAAKGCAWPAGLPAADELDKMAKAYAENTKGTAIRSREYLIDLLEHQGFVLEDARFGNLVKHQDHQRSGAPVAGRKEYAWLVARRA